MFFIFFPYRSISRIKKLGFSNARRISVVRHLSETNVCQADVAETGDEMDAKVALRCGRCGCIV